MFIGLFGFFLFFSFSSSNRNCGNEKVGDAVESSEKFCLAIDYCRHICQYNPADSWPTFSPPPFSSCHSFL